VSEFIESRTTEKKTEVRTQFVVTVVIVTLGGESLGDTVRAVNSGSLVPAEVLVCIPRTRRDTVDWLASRWSNLEIIPTIAAGQVLQRIEGFKRARVKSFFN
jgi:hypothetical protein